MNNDHVKHRNGWIIQFDSSDLAPSWKIPNVYGHLTPLWYHRKNGHMT